MDKSPNLLDSKTATAPMLEASEPAGSGIIPELVTADRSRHAKGHTWHDARVEREYQVGDASSAVNFLRLLGGGSVRSPWSEKDMPVYTNADTKPSNEDLSNGHAPVVGGAL